MTDGKKIIPRGPVDATVRVPGSKSITNRALFLAALASGESTLLGLLDSEDTRAMIEALRALGLRVDQFGDGAVRVAGCGGVFPNRTAEFDVANSGTTARFLTAGLALAGGHYRLFGKERMHQRPIGDLLRALRELGADVTAEYGNDSPPVIIRPNESSLSHRQRHHASIAGDISSQFLSALLMAAPILTSRTDSCATGVRLTVVGELVSRPYIEMTCTMMRDFGVDVMTDAAWTTFDIDATGGYLPRQYMIEPDASAASYFFAIPAICGGRVVVQGLTRKSLQGDVGFVDCLEKMGCRVEEGDDFLAVSRAHEDGKLTPLRGIDIDMNAISDTAQTLAVVALFAETPTRIRHVAHMRNKETDRIAAVVTELRKLGGRVEEFDDGLAIFPADSTHAESTDSGSTLPESTLHGARIATYDDHRMAMSFSLAGLKIPGVEIADPECTAKTYPEFFTDWDRLFGDTT